MNFSSALIENAVNEFAKLPGIGKRTALRLVLHFLNQSEQETSQFATAISTMRSEIKFCGDCGNISDNDQCGICSSTSRNKQVVCVVESIREVMAIENTQQYNGVYHVLGGVVSPINGVSPDMLNINSLIKRVEENGIEEVIMALNPTVDGDTTVFYISKKLKDTGARISTIARGVAFGGELEFVDEVTLARSIESRIPYSNYMVD